MNRTKSSEFKSEKNESKGNYKLKRALEYVNNKSRGSKRS